MKRLLLCLLLVAVLAAPVMAAAYDTFQDWENHTVYSTNGATWPYVAVSDDTTGEIKYQDTGSWGKIHALTSAPFQYAAYDGGLDLGVGLNNAAGTVVCNFGTVTTSQRAEIVINASLYAVLYVNGTRQGTCGPLVTYPYNIEIYPYYGTNLYDNFVVGGTDHHAISTIPNNWTIVRDILNPTATGVYAQSNTGSFDVLKNSQYFYIHADTDSTAGLGIESVQILNSAGAVVNTTSINSATPHHIISYNINNFLTEASNGYGRYTAKFQGSQQEAQFFVIGSGAAISFDRNAYSQGDTATATYTVTNAYWDTSTFDYRVDFIDATTWTTKGTNPITTQTGSKTYTFTTNDNAGTYYAVIIAKYKSTGVDAWMNIDWADLDTYVTFYGYVMNQTGSVISGANVNISQGSIITNTTSFADGNYTATGYYTGSITRLNVTASGYSQYNVSLIPLAAKRVYLNFTLNSTAPSIAGNAIGGVARDGAFNDTTQMITNGYGRPIEGATVYVWNKTGMDRYTRTTNIAGWYLCGESESCYLTKNQYDIWGSKTGYNNSVNHTVVVMS